MSIGELILAVMMGAVAIYIVGEIIVDTLREIRSRNR